MEEEQIESRVVKAVAEPRLSLKRFSQYMVATEKGKTSILRQCKYPGGDVPRYYEMARRLVCEMFAANFDDRDLYFDEFKMQAQAYRNEAKAYPENRDGHKNRIYSATGLEGISAMSSVLSPILDQYVFNSNLSHKKDFIAKNGVRIGAVADMLVSDDNGARQVGFLKFNFTTKEMSKGEAGTMLFVLKEFFSSRGVELAPKACILVDVFARRIFTAANMANMAEGIDKNTREIKKNWDSL